MSRYFNVSGPCVPEEHYMLDAVSRLNRVLPLIERNQYFVIRSAQQSGKTTFLFEMRQKLNQNGEYYALYCSLESIQGIDDSEKGIPSIIGCLSLALESSTIPHKEQFAIHANKIHYTSALLEALSDFCSLLDKPLVVFFDEADRLSGSTLISFLRQLRNGYITRSYSPFIHSLALVGMQNLRDYKLNFNIVTELLTLQNFSKEDIAELYGQHSTDTGQQFEPEAVEYVWQQTQGQPWLVNAIACETVEEILKSDYSQTVTLLMVEQAVQNIILRRDTHIDSLMERLNEERVRKIIQPIILGEVAQVEYLSSDFQLTRDLGLIRQDQGKLEFANPIYAEVIIRTLNFNTQISLQNNTSYQPSRYIHNGKIDMELLLRDFQVFWRENGAIWKEKYLYKETAPHLVLMAFLQRIINGGGKIIREMAAETGRLDLLVVYGENKYPIELKIRHNKNAYQKGLEQTAGYMESLGCQNGWLVVFDRRQNISWETKLFVRNESFDNKTITIIGC
ncbi:MAG: hypothetical protein LBQ66_07140 [Planctomycetaceae bacterium]|jgi:hypothetical protein|nr:hypothetical protein [Planctomycetaceae bacterium]